MSIFINVKRNIKTSMTDRGLLKKKNFRNSKKVTELFNLAANSYYIGAYISTYILTKLFISLHI